MTEQDIERVLEGLGRAEAPQGLEERVQRAMRAHHPPAAQRWFALACAGATALVVTALCIGVAKQRESALTTEEQKMARAGVFNSPPPAYHATPDPVSPAFRMNLAVAVTPYPDARPRQSSRFERAGLQSRHNTSSNQPALAAEGMSVAEEPGFPAPEAPLTDQERLLLKLARRPNEATIAMFDQGIRDERAAAEKAEFDFLNPQRPVETEPPTDSKPPTDSTLKEEKSDDRSQSKR